VRRLQLRTRPSANFNAVADLRPRRADAETLSVSGGRLSGEEASLKTSAHLVCSDVVHIRQLERLFQRTHFREGVVIENKGDGVAGVDHHQPDRAILQIRAVVASPISSDRSAPDRRQWAVKSADDCADPNLMSRTGKRVAATPPLF
jgi:hypothetical protein